MKLPRGTLSGVLLFAAIAFLIALPRLLSEQNLHFAVEVLISGLFAMSLGLIMGQGGMISLGHAAFFGIGGYTAGLLLLRAHFPFWTTLVISPLVAALAGGLIGSLSVRRTHTYLLMLTFALGQLVYTVFFRWRSLTGGDDGLIGIRPPRWLLSTDSYYWFALVIVGLSILGLHRINNSPFGYGLRAIRDSANRAAASGIPVVRQKVAAFIVSAFFAGVAGCLSAYFNRGMFPGSASWLHSADAFVSVIVGGPLLFLGPLAGAVILETLGEFISRYTVYWFLFLGVSMVIIAIVAPSGVLSMPWVGRWIRRREAEPDAIAGQPPAGAEGG